MKKAFGKEGDNKKFLWSGIQGMVLSDFAISPDFSFLAVDTNKSHKYQLMFCTVIKFLPYLYENSLMLSDQILLQKLFACDIRKKHMNWKSSDHLFMQ